MCCALSYPLYFEFSCRCTRHLSKWYTLWDANAEMNENFLWPYSNTISKSLFKDSHRHIFWAMRKMTHTFWKHQPLAVLKKSSLSFQKNLMEAISSQICYHFSIIFDLQEFWEHHLVFALLRLLRWLLWLHPQRILNLVHSINIRTVSS